MKTVNQDWKQLLRDIFDIVRNVEGAGLVSEIDSVLNKYTNYLNTTPLPIPVATWLDNLIDLLNNVEGAELESELADLKSPLKASV
jgi:hypothetical protein